MKQLYLSLLLLLTLVGTALAQANKVWPRNPKTGNIEFSGKCTFSGESAKPENIQRFVREWAKANTDDYLPGNNESFTNKGSFYIGLSKTLRDSMVTTPFAFLCFVDFQLIPNGFTYKLNGFTCTYTPEYRIEQTGLEAFLEIDSPKRQRVAAAYWEEIRKALTALKYKKPGQ